MERFGYPVPGMIFGTPVTSPGRGSAPVPWHAVIDPAQSVQCGGAAVSAGAIIVWDLLGTAALILLCNGVVSNHVLRKTNGNNGGILFINFGWAFAVFTGASIAAPSGAHLNPAVTLGLALADQTPWADGPVYFIRPMAGAFLGAMPCRASYHLQFVVHPDPEYTLGIFSTA